MFQVNEIIDMIIFNPIAGWLLFFISLLIFFKFFKFIAKVIIHYTDKKF